MHVLKKNIFYLPAIFLALFLFISCDIINNTSPVSVYHSYASFSVSADTVQAGSTVDVHICIWNHGNDLYELSEEAEGKEMRLAVLLEGEEPDYKTIWCPVGTGNILLDRHYVLSETGSYTISMAQPDGSFQERVVVVQ